MFISFALKENVCSSLLLFVVSLEAMNCKIPVVVQPHWLGHWKCIPRPIQILIIAMSEATMVCKLEVQKLLHGYTFFFFQNNQANIQLFHSIYHLHFQLRVIIVNILFAPCGVNENFTT